LPTLLGTEVTLAYPDAPLPVRVKPARLKRYLHAEAHAQKVTLLKFIVPQAEQNLLDPQFDFLEDPSQIIMVIRRQLSDPPLGRKDRQLAENAAKLRINDKRMDGLSKR